MMSTQNRKKVPHIEVESDRSPVCKKARYEENLKDNEVWTLSKNELILHSDIDSGVERLATDCEFYLKKELRDSNLSTPKSSDTPVSKMEQIAVLEAALPENVLHKLSLGELDNILMQKDRSLEPRSDRNHFDSLSDEVVLNIFQRLGKSELCNVALVCHRFSQLIEDETLWTRMDISDRILDPGSMGIIMGRQVIILRLARSKILSPPIWPSMKAAQTDFHWRIMYLDLSMAVISRKSLIAIFNKCRRLKKLSLESVPISDNVLTALSANRDLEILNLAMASGVGMEGLKVLLGNCRKIKELNLSWTYLDGEIIDFVCDNLPIGLDRFNFAGCRKLLQDENVVQLVSNCPYLSELDLSDCTSITGEAVKTLTMLDELHFLSLSRCYLIPYRSLLFLKKMKRLAYLDIHGSYINADEFKIINDGLGVSVNINKFKFSSIARPAVGNKRHAIWNMIVRD